MLKLTDLSLDKVSQHATLYPHEENENIPTIGLLFTSSNQQQAGMNKHCPNCSNKYFLLNFPNEWLISQMNLYKPYWKVKLVSTPPLCMTEFPTRFSEIFPPKKTQMVRVLKHLRQPGKPPNTPLPKPAPPNALLHPPPV